MADKTSTRDDDVARGFIDEGFSQDGDEEPSPPSFIPLPLPQLTDEPQALPDCCLSLSLPLLRELHGLLPPAPHLTLSIGSGTGLVEGLLHALASSSSSLSSSSPPHAMLNLVSVEVAPSPNRYHVAHRTVPGTWALDPLAGEARAWVFVYPKQVALVRDYMAAFSGGKGCAVETVVYIGPRRDWDDFRAAFEGFARDVEVWDEEKMEAAGGRAWECLAVVRPEKRGRSPSPPDS